MKLYTKGFTLIELLVVISIIGVLTTVVGFSAAEVRENARDAKRISDVEQIGLALRLYEQEYGAVPDCDRGTVLEIGRIGMYTIDDCHDELAIKQYLIDYFGELPTDPLGPGNVDYYYYYESRHVCFNTAHAVMVFAVNLESKDSNASDACERVDGADGGYLRTVSINPSQPYVYVINTDR